MRDNVESLRRQLMSVQSDFDTYRQIFLGYADCFAPIITDCFNGPLRLHRSWLGNNETILN